MASASSYNIIYKASCTGAVGVTTKATGLVSVSLLNSTFGTGFFYATGINQMTQAHLQAGAVGKTGPPIAWAFNATYGPLSGTIKASFTFNPSVHNISFLLAAGLVYFNIHTTAYPSGELRGQLSPVKQGSSPPPPPPASPSPPLPIRPLSNTTDYVEIYLSNLNLMSLPGSSPSSVDSLLSSFVNVTEVPSPPVSIVLSNGLPILETSWMNSRNFVLYGITAVSNIAGFGTVGNVLNALIGFLWPAPSPTISIQNIWDDLKSSVEQVVNQKMDTTTYNNAQSALNGIKSSIAQFTTTVEEYSANNSAVVTSWRPIATSMLQLIESNLKTSTDPHVSALQMPFFTAAVNLYIQFYRLALCP